MSETMILEGDSLEVLKDLPDNSIDCVVTDPPYGLAFMGKKWDYDVPSIALWTEVLRVLKPGGHLLSFGGTRTYHRMVIAIEDAGFEVRDQIMWIYGSGFPKSHNLDGEHEGWGTALKPANEPIVLARKPLSESTVAKNVLRWGTGALNIDGTRIPGIDPANAKRLGRDYTTDKTNFSEKVTQVKAAQVGGSLQGRWPANVLFDEEAALALDEQSGVSKSGGGKSSGKTFHGQDYIKDHNERPTDSGGASRFFYVAKASKRERNAGLEGMPEVSKSHIASVDGGGGGWSKDSAKNPNLPRANHHPTVKPIKLMEYLIKLVCPPDGTVLDPFAGSGTTLVAAQNLGFTSIGIEREPEYIKIIEGRTGNKAS